nr:MAG TPA: hypothetical protein [Caudoviricetes sp.]
MSKSNRSVYHGSSRPAHAGRDFSLSSQTFVLISQSI